MFALVAIFVVMPKINSDNEENDKNKNTVLNVASSGSPSASPVPSLQPSFNPTLNPTSARFSEVVSILTPSIQSFALSIADQHEKEEEKERVKLLVEENMIGSWNDSRSPQYRALLWLSNEDEYTQEIIYQNNNSSNFPIQIEGHTTTKLLLKRYALAVFYYATNGEYWIDSCNFLSPDKHVCDWKSTILPRGRGVTLCVGLEDERAPFYLKLGEFKKRIE
eukprot:2097365-Ditylum_brightwellii.AAC.2